MSKASLKIVETGSPLDEARGRLKAEQDHLDDELRLTAEAESSRQKILLDGDDNLLDQFESSIAGFQKTCARRRERITILEKHIAALEAEQLAEDNKAEKQAKYDTARMLVDQAIEFQKVGYRQHAQAIADGLELMRNADRAVAQVNADLPAGQQPLPIPSQANHVSATDGDIGWRPLPIYERVGELPGVDRHERRLWPK